MNHDATHCADYDKNCPKSCYRAQLTQELLDSGYPWPVPWGLLKGTVFCPIENGDEEE